MGALVALVTLPGCRGGKVENRAQLEVMIPLVAAQVVETLLGIPSRSLGSSGEPPLLGVQGRDLVVLAADEKAFSELVGEGVRPEDIRRVVGKLSEELNKSLRRRRFSSIPSTFPPSCGESERPRAVLAAITPYILETGGPQEKATGKSQKLLMARLLLTEAKTQQTLASREFYTGYTLTSSRASR